jgi:hypothetical protein
MKDWVRKALTKTVARKGPRGKFEVIVVEPDEKLVLLVKFAIGMTLCLSGLEVANIIVLGKFSNEIFSAITGLIGTVTGVLISHHS